MSKFHLKKTAEISLIRDKILKDSHHVNEYVKKHSNHSEILPIDMELLRIFENLLEDLKKFENISQTTADKYLELYTERYINVSKIVVLLTNVSFKCFVPIFIHLGFSCLIKVFDLKNTKNSY